MNWRVIALLSLFGLTMGLITISIVPSNIEPFFWVAIMLISAYLIARFAPGRYFVHGLLVSVANSVWITIAHAAFFYQYVATHPEFIKMTDALPPALAAHPRRMMVIIGPLTGIFFGLILGLLAWVASRFVKGR